MGRTWCIVKDQGQPQSAGSFQKRTGPANVMNLEFHSSHFKTKREKCNQDDALISTGQTVPVLPNHIGCKGITEYRLQMIGSWELFCASVYQIQCQS